MRAYGPGIEPNGVVIGEPANFTVEVFSAGKGDVDVSVEDPDGNTVPVRIIVYDIIILKNRVIPFRIIQTSLRIFHEL